MALSLSHFLFVGLCLFVLKTYRRWTVETTYEHSFEDCVLPTVHNRRRASVELTWSSLVDAGVQTARSWGGLIHDFLAIAIELLLLLIVGTCTTLSSRAVNAADRVNWPDTWELFSYFLPKKTQERVFEPARQDLLADYRKANKKYKHKAARFILNLAWSFRFALLVADCWRAILTDKAFGMLLSTVPEPIKQWWRA